MPVRYRRATAVCRRGSLPRERTALARCRLRTSQYARRGVLAERAAELARPNEERGGDIRWRKRESWRGLNASG
jgi:hypothetical protein